MMLETTLILLAAGGTGLVAAYWICLIVGGGLLLISCVTGSDTHADAGVDFGGDASFHADVGVDAPADLPPDAHVGGDVGHDVSTDHHGAGSLTTWFSIQFAVFFMAVFGVIGVVLTHLVGAGRGVTAGTAVVGGLIVGQGVHQLLRKLRRTSGDSTPQRKDYVNKLARVTIAITPPNKGEIVLRVGRADRYVPAVAKRADTAFGISEEVAVVGYAGGVAEVVSREEYEFVTGKDQGDLS